jgi:hypothetical protein
MVIKRKSNKEETEWIKGMEDPESRDETFRILVSGMDSHQVNELEQGLYRIEGMRLLLICGSVEDGNEFVVSTSTPIALTKALRGMHFIDDVTENGNTININIKTEYVTAL